MEKIFDNRPIGNRDDGISARREILLLIHLHKNLFKKNIISNYKLVSISPTQSAPQYSLNLYFILS